MIIHEQTTLQELALEINRRKLAVTAMIDAQGDYTCMIHPHDQLLRFVTGTGKTLASAVRNAFQKADQTDENHAPAKLR